MNICSFIITTFLCIAGSTSASFEAFDNDSIRFEAFEDDFSIYAEVKAYCKSPAEYHESIRGEKYGPIEGWNVSAVTKMDSLFYDKSACNPPISKWDVSEVTTFRSMFLRAAAFNQDLSKWNVGNGQNFWGMFYGAAAFNQDLSKWNVANGLYFHYMFYKAAAFNQDLSKWNVGNGQTFYYMFYKAAAFNQDLSEWNVANGLYFSNMFKDSRMNHFIGDWKFTSMENGVGRLNIFFSMLTDMSYDHYDDASNEEWEQQLKNFVPLIVPKNDCQ